MEVQMEQQQELDIELDTIALRIFQRRGLYSGFVLDDYKALKEKEDSIARNQKIETITIEDVIADLKRNGSEETQLMSRAFLSKTTEKIRNAYSFGYDELVVYFAIGEYSHNNELELGLISSHMPGSPGGGGWGLNGTRKLQLVEKPNGKGFNLEKWIKNSLAWAQELYDGRIQYIYEKDESFSSLLQTAIEQERNN